MRTVSFVLIACLVANNLPAQQRPTDAFIKQEIAAFPSTSLVQVTLKGEGRMRGRIVSRGDSDFSLEREKRAGTQRIAYDQVLSVSQVKAGHSHKKWVIIGIVVAAVVVVAILAARVASHPLQGI